MADKDITEKNLEAYNDVFADIVNVLLFDGKEIVKPDELTDAAPNSMLKLENEIHEQERDIAKYWGKSKVRIEVPKLLEPYVNDYKINIREIAWLSDEQIASFKNDFRYVAEFFRLKRLKQNLKFDDKVPAHIDAIMKLLTALSGDEKYTEVLKSEGGKPKTMCEMIERLQAGLKAEIAELKQEKAATDKENAELKQEKAAADKENAELKQEIVKLKAALAAKG